MTTVAFRNARSWFRQADSDVRTATALLQSPEPMTSADVGCHVAALCAQSLEKSLKGYVFLNGATPAMDHRPDKYLSLLLTAHGLLRFHAHLSHLAKLLDQPTRASIRELFDLTPGGLGHACDVPNTEYPWMEAGEWQHFPAGCQKFQDMAALQDWLHAATRVCSTLHRLAIAAERTR